MVYISIVDTKDTNNCDVFTVTQESWCLLHGKDPKMEICEGFLRDEPVGT